jgi:hypothetical protein
MHEAQILNYECLMLNDGLRQFNITYSTFTIRGARLRRTA